MRKITLRANGMNSPAHQAIIESQLSVINGVCFVKVELEAGQILLHVENGFELLQIFESLRAEGFSFAGHLISSEISVDNDLVKSNEVGDFPSSSVDTPDDACTSNKESYLC